jgi:hypothetical protein
LPKIGNALTLLQQLTIREFLRNFEEEHLPTDGPRNARWNKFINVQQEKLNEWYFTKPEDFMRTIGDTGSWADVSFCCQNF